MAAVLEELTAEEITKLRSAAERDTYEVTARALNVNETTLTRAVAGRPIQRMTANLIRQHLGTVPRVEL